MFARYLPPEYSGAAAQAFLLARQLRLRGHAVEFVTQSWSGEPRTYEVDGFAVTALGARLEARHQEFSIWGALARHLLTRRAAVDILHGHGAYYIQSVLGPIGRILRRPTLVKASMSNNDLSSLSNSSIAPVHRRFLRLVNAYVAISDDLHTELRERGLDERRIWHIPNGVDTARFHPVPDVRRAQLAAELGLPADRPLGLYVGVFDERKRIQWLAEHWVESDGFGTGTTLVAVGPTSREPYGASLREALEELARQYPQRLVIRDYAADIERYYQAANLLVFPSRKEGLPNAVLEGMACGLPCVAARACGSRELVRDGVNGATFAIDDAAELAAALSRTRGDAAADMGSASRQLAVNGFAIEQVADRYEELYRHLASDT
jgi:glycosyltransferase involved in cell wall biosynthesis